MLTMITTFLEPTHFIAVFAQNWRNVNLSIFVIVRYSKDHAPIRLPVLLRSLLQGMKHGNKNQWSQIYTYIKTFNFSLIWFMSNTGIMESILVCVWYIKNVPLLYVIPLRWIKNNFILTFIIYRRSRFSILSSTCHNQNLIPCYKWQCFSLSDDNKNAAFVFTTQRLLYISIIWFFFRLKNIYV